MTTKPRRPPLSAVMGPANPTTSSSAASTDEAPAPKPRGRKPGRRKQGHNSLLVYVPPELHKGLKMRALEENRDMSDIVTELIAQYVRTAP